MITFNPGNVLRFVTKKRWQRHRLEGQDVLPFGLQCPQSRILPWQVFLDLEELPELNYTLVNAAQETDTLLQSNDLLEVRERSGGGYYVTYKADTNLTQIPPCGFWYVKLGYDDQEVYSEVLHTKPDPGFDTVSLILVEDSCNLSEGGVLTFDLLAVDELSATPSSQTVQAFINDAWQTIGPTGGEVMLAEFPPNEVMVRRVVTTASGQQITANYIVSWSDAGGPCDDIHIEPDGDVIKSGGTFNSKWRFRVKNETDKGINNDQRGGVLYQTGYEQQYYLTRAPGFGRPILNREEQRKTDGFGNRTSQYSRTEERIYFEVADIPDFMFFFFKNLSDNTQVILEEVVSGEGFDLVNAQFDSRVQGAGLNIGEFQCDGAIEVFSGCQENYVLLDP